MFEVLSTETKFEVVEAILDAIAFERESQMYLHRKCLSEMETHRDAGRDGEMGRSSTEAERYLSAAHALSVALRKCQSISDRSVSNARGGSSNEGE